MRAPLPVAACAIVLLSMPLVACDQDYASSNSGREPFMAVQAAPAPSAAPSASASTAAPAPSAAAAPAAH